MVEAGMAEAAIENRTNINSAVLRPPKKSSISGSLRQFD